MELSTPCGCANITVPETSTSALTIQSNSLDVDDSILLDITSRDDKSTNIEGTVDGLLHSLFYLLIFYLLTQSHFPLSVKLSETKRVGQYLFSSAMALLGKFI